MKKHYNQPEVTVASIALQSNLLAGSAAPAPANNMGMNDIPGEQW